jgi:hypothetical protein
MDEMTQSIKKEAEDAMRSAFGQMAEHLRGELYDKDEIQAAWEQVSFFGNTIGFSFLEGDLDCYATTTAFIFRSLESYQEASTVKIGWSVQFEKDAKDLIKLLELAIKKAKKIDSEQS